MYECIQCGARVEQTLKHKGCYKGFRLVPRAALKQGELFGRIELCSEWHSELDKVETPYRGVVPKRDRASHA